MIEYRTGDCLDAPERPVVFAHVVNDAGKWGAGFSGALGSRYPWAESSYRTWAGGGEKETPFRLGTSFLVLLGGDIGVLHLLAQHGVGRGQRRLDYEALGNALAFARDHSFEGPGRVNRAWPIVMPRIGCGLAGGSWGEVEPLVREELSEFRVIVYDLSRSPQ